MLLMTGGSGFIGQHLQREFSDVYAPREADMNLTDPTQIEKVIRDTRPEVVVHLAAKTEVAWSFDDYLNVSNVNYVGTVALAEACRRFNPNLRLFVLASTMETYGHQEERLAFTEQTPQWPAAPYAVAKVAAEKYLAYMEYAYGFPFTVLRQTNTYGREDNDFFVVERTVTQMLNGGVCRLGDPEPWRNFLYVDDLVRLYRTVVDQRPVGETFVTGPDNALPIRDLADKIRALTGFQGEVEWHTQPPRPGEIYYLNSDPQKAHDLLGWYPKVGLDEGLKLTVDKWVT